MNNKNIGFSSGSWRISLLGANPEDKSEGFVNRTSANLYHENAHHTMTVSLFQIKDSTGDV